MGQSAAFLATTRFFLKEVVSLTGTYLGCEEIRARSLPRSTLVRKPLRLPSRLCQGGLVSEASKVLAWQGQDSTQAGAQTNLSVSRQKNSGHPVAMIWQSSFHLLVVIPVLCMMPYDHGNAQVRLQLQGCKVMFFVSNQFCE